MRSRGNQLVADRVVEFYKKFSPSRRETYRHFGAEGVGKSTICVILNRFDKTGSSTYSKNSGPKPTCCDEKLLYKVGKAYIENPNVTERKLAARFNVSKSTISKCKKKLGAKSNVRTKVPKYIKDQENRARKAARRIDNKTREIGPNVIYLIDDEKYCYADPNQIPIRRFYTELPGFEVSLEHKTVPKGKFEKKYGVWQCMATNGQVSPPVTFNGTMNGERYLNSCLKSVLVPWIEENFDINNCILWQDMATYHYKPEVREYLESIGLAFISKKENGPNMPQCRPIEKFWALVEREMAAYSTPAKNLKSFSMRWNICSRRVAERSGFELTKNFNKRIRMCKILGPRAVAAHNINKQTCAQYY